MKSISSELKAHLAEEVTTLATCWKVTRRDNTVLGFTDHDRDILFDSVTYQAATGFTPTSIVGSAALNVDNLDIEGLLDAAAITEEDLLAGLYDFAEIEVFMVNYADLTQGRMMLRTGWLGEVTVKDGQFVAEVRGLTQQLSQTIGELYAPGCRARLGGSRCKMNMTGFTHIGTLTSVSDRNIFTDSTRTEEDGYFAFGLMTFTSGANAGLSMEIKEFANGQFITVLPMPYDVNVGDGYSAEAGCDKTFETCISRFNNAVNFRGEPHVPGTDKIFETSTTRSS